MNNTGILIREGVDSDNSLANLQQVMKQSRGTFNAIGLAEAGATVVVTDMNEANAHETAAMIERDLFGQELGNHMVLIWINSG